MTDVATVKSVLARLANGEGPIDGQADELTTPRTGSPARYRRVIETASAATQDLEVAAEFVADGGIERLEAAVEHAEREVSSCADEGREALETFREYRRAADGDHFQSGDDTSIGRPPKGIDR